MVTERNIQRILIANRGEIACRIATTAKRLNIETVAVYSDADRFSRHVALCDQAVYLGASPVAQSYLCIDKIIEAAKRLGVDAIHPGYGFLSENVLFAKACSDAGIIFIGPPIDAIEAMGSKSAAKLAVSNADVPLIPGYLGEDQSPQHLLSQAITIGFPLMIKAVMGGGGKGMRRVESESDFLSALSSCQREAQAAFGDARVLLEKYVQTPRHIEIQVFGDQFGHYVHLGERDCSIQRRHQKILEEAPAIGLTTQQRQQLGDVAIRCAKAVGYVGAGTVEFMMAPDGQFYFMEMNTRLQVEHPVTEMLTGFDLVEWQIKIASGLPLSVNQDDIEYKGAAIELRLCAENPDQDFFPAIGRIESLSLPASLVFQVGDRLTPRVRVDSGVVQGTVVTPYYDSMLAKIIAWAPTRSACIDVLRDYLSQVFVLGVKTNLSFLNTILNDALFCEGGVNTGFLQERGPALADSYVAHTTSTIALAHCLGNLITAQTLSVEMLGNASHLVGVRKELLEIQGTRVEVDASLQHDHQRKTLTMHVNGEHALTFDLAQWHARDGIESLDTYSFELNHTRYSVKKIVSQQGIWYVINGISSLVEYATKEDQSQAHSDNQVRASLPGRIVKCFKQSGDQVTKNEPLVILEAMKMEHTLCAPCSGTLTEWQVTEGQQVAEGSVLIEIDVE